MKNILLATKKIAPGDELIKSANVIITIHIGKPTQKLGFQKARLKLTWMGIALLPLAALAAPVLSTSISEGGMYFWII